MEDMSTKDRSNDGTGTFKERVKNTVELLQSAVPTLLAVSNEKSAKNYWKTCSKCNSLQPIK